MSKSDYLDPITGEQLAELEAALAHVRPVADPAFLARLEHDIAHGFAGDQPTRRWTWPSLRLMLPVGGAALAAAVVAVVIATGDTASPPTDNLAAAPTAETAAPQSSAGSTGAAPSSKSLSTPAPTEDSAAVRQVERSASLTLAATDGTVQDTADKIVETTGRLGGYVSRSSVSVQEQGGSADLQLRVPSNRLDEAMTALAKLGHVQAMDQNEQDITGTFSAAAAALEDAKAERQGLLAGLRKATEPGQIARFKLRLRENAARVTAADAALTSVRSRATRATISVQVTSGGKTSGAVHEEGFGLGVATTTAVRVLSASAGVLILILAGALPLIAVTLIAFAALRAARRRSREQALQRSSGSNDR